MFIMDDRGTIVVLIIKVNTWARRSIRGRRVQVNCHGVVISNFLLFTRNVVASVSLTILDTDTYSDDEWTLIKAFDCNRAHLKYHKKPHNSQKPQFDLICCDSRNFRLNTRAAHDEQQQIGLLFAVLVQQTCKHVQCGFDWLSISMRSDHETVTQLT